MQRTRTMPDALLETVWTDALAGADAADYDRFVDAAAGGHAAQTRGWAKLATTGRRFDTRWFLAREAGGAVVGAALVLRPRAIGPLALPVAIVERGPVVAAPDDLARVVPAFVSVARKHGVARVQVMPYFADADAERAEAALAAAGLRDVQELDGAHAATLRLAIAGKTDDAILEGKDRKKLRYELKHAAKIGATVRRGEPKDMGELARLYEALMGSQGKSGKPAAWFDAAAAHLLDPAAARGALFLCDHAGETLSAVLVTRHANVATFLMGASIPSPRPFSKMALPLMEAIRWAREAGATIFDMGGVPLEGDDDEKRAAIAQFKFDFTKTRTRLVREHARWF
jgi:lipid II:glycine glycyltransferase (peptidoglycan interpeptide bridge formation enzyme)